MAMLEKNDLTKLKCKKEFGEWYYYKIVPSCWNDLDAPIFRLYDSELQMVNEFGSYGDMKYYVETGIVI